MSEPAARTAYDPRSIWNLVSERLQAIIPRQSFLTWFRPLEPIEFDGAVLTIQVPSQFYMDWIESHYGSHLLRALVEATGLDLKHHLVVSSGRNGSVRPSERPSGPALPVGFAAPTPQRRREEPFDSRLNLRYQFDNFIEGACNRFARAAALSIAESPGKTAFNPLMIYGGAGLGKTHLIQAIGNSIVKSGAVRRVLYVTGEQFTADFIKAIQDHKADTFSRLYRSVDVLLLDDVQFFMAKEKTQEEFFHTFNHLHQAGKQLVFSSDRPPRELEGFDPRLVSRLQWGLVSQITIPEYETRLAILRRRAEEERVELPGEVAHFLALHITDNIRTLQASLIHLLAQTSLMGKTISVEMAREVISTLVSNIERKLSVERIQTLVSEEYGLPSDLLRSKTRKREIAEARQVAMFLCTEFTRLTLKAIGLHFGGRDHATVIHARETVSERSKSDTSFNENLENLRKKLELASF